MSHRDTDPNDVTRVPFSLDISIRPMDAVKIRQAIKRARALGLAETDGEAIIRFVDSWLSNEGRRTR